ncbi:MAG: hypothetical protein V7609_1885 [Verrucomicrobiota bacterium]
MEDGGRVLFLCYPLFSILYLRTGPRSARACLLDLDQVRHEHLVRVAK